MRLQIYNSSYELSWETNECSHWVICNGANNEYNHPYIKLSFDNENANNIFKANIQYFNDIQEPFFLVLDTHNGLKRCIVYNPIIQHLNQLEYIFYYEYYSMMSTLLNIRDEDFSNFIRQIHQNYVLRTARKYTNEWEECFEKNCSNTFKDILNKEIEELE
jgi:hypothetical protein